MEKKKQISNAAKLLCKKVKQQIKDCDTLVEIYQNMQHGDLTVRDRRRLDRIGKRYE